MTKKITYFIILDKTIPKDITHNINDICNVQILSRHMYIVKFASHINTCKLSLSIAQTSIKNKIKYIKECYQQIIDIENKNTTKENKYSLIEKTIFYKEFTCLASRNLVKRKYNIGEQYSIQSAIKRMFYAKKYNISIKGSTDIACIKSIITIENLKKIQYNRLIKIISESEQKYQIKYQNTYIYSKIIKQMDQNATNIVQNIEQIDPYIILKYPYIEHKIDDQTIKLHQRIIKLLSVETKIAQINKTPIQISKYKSNNLRLLLTNIAEELSKHYMKNITNQAKEITKLEYLQELKNMLYDNIL